MTPLLRPRGRSQPRRQRDAACARSDHCSEPVASCWAGRKSAAMQVRWCYFVNPATISGTCEARCCRGGDHGERCLADLDRRVWPR